MVVITQAGAKYLFGISLAIILGVPRNGASKIREL
jgi:hypothetical protein